MKTKLLLSALIALSFNHIAYAVDGTVKFTGQIVDTVCPVSITANSVGCSKDVITTNSEGQSIKTTEFVKSLDVSKFPKQKGESTEFEYQGQKASIEKVSAENPYYTMTLNVN